MTTLPASLYYSNNSRTEGEGKQTIEDIRDVISELLGGSAESELTISSGSVTPTAAVHTIDTEGDAASDDLSNIALTNHPDGRILIIRAENASRVVTVKHAAGGDGQIYLKDDTDLVFTDTDTFLLLMRSGSAWIEVSFYREDFLLEHQSTGEHDLFEMHMDRYPILVNGGFEVWQRGTTFNAAANGQITADNWEWVQSLGTGVVNITADATVRPGATAGQNEQYVLKIDVATAEAAIAAGEFAGITTRIEGYDYWRYLHYNDDDWSIGFWARSSTTGTFCVAVQNYGTPSDRSYVSEFTISAADTWEYFEMTVEGLVDGTWNTTNGTGCKITFTLACGSDYQGTGDQWNSANDIATSNQDNFLVSTDNDFYLALVNPGPGLNPGPYPITSFAEMLRRCQRYYQHSYTYGTVVGTATNDGRQYVYVTAVASADHVVGLVTRFPVTMRAAPTITLYDMAGASAKVTMISGNGIAGTSEALSNKSFDAYGTNGAANTGRMLMYHWAANADLP